MTITGNALPADATVRIGDSTPVRVVKSSSTSLTFDTPRLVAGTYDVHVFSPDGRTSVLEAGLTVVGVADGAVAGSRRTAGRRTRATGSAPASHRTPTRTRSPTTPRSRS